MRERGLKLPPVHSQHSKHLVAPVRERGLKLLRDYHTASVQGRSREGAWIEIRTVASIMSLVKGRSREGAWIEIQRQRLLSCPPMSLP